MEKSVQRKLLKEDEWVRQVFSISSTLFNIHLEKILDAFHGKRGGEEIATMRSRNIEFIRFGDDQVIYWLAAKIWLNKGTLTTNVWSMVWKSIEWFYKEYDNETKGLKFENRIGSRSLTDKKG